MRGTWLDPFGRTAERKMERALIAEYRQTVDQLLDGLNADKLGQAATIAALAETVRGFGHVKAANVEKYRTELARLMQAIRRLRLATCPCAKPRKHSLSRVRSWARLAGRAQCFRNNLWRHGHIFFL